MDVVMTEPNVGTFTEYEQWWDKEAKPLYEEWLGLPFFTDLRAGRLTEDRLKAWLGNWYGHVQEADMHALHAIDLVEMYHQVYGMESVIIRPLSLYGPAHSMFKGP